VRLPNTTKHHLPELFELGAASCRQRFQAQLSWAASIAFCVPVVPRPSDCGSVEGAIQCDEATFAGATKGKRGQGAAGKVIVFGRVKRNDRVKAMPIPARDRMPIMLEIDAHTREDTLY
jgi:transposase